MLGVQGVRKGAQPGCDKQRRPAGFPERMMRRMCLCVPIQAGGYQRRHRNKRSLRQVSAMAAHLSGPLVQVPHVDAAHAAREISFSRVCAKLMGRLGG